MNITVFAKKRTSNDGRTFFSYISTLTRVDGSQLTVSVSFREECGQPKAERCPANLIIPRESANLSRRTYTDSKTGEERESFTLWVSEWQYGEEYVDHSLDEFV